jgi:aldehyde:ferredoxin oxidoreductase
MIKEMNTLCLVRIDISNNKMNTEKIEESLLKAFLGGSGPSIRFLLNGLDINKDSFDPESPIIFMRGLLTGTSIPAACKSSVCGKSPLTGIWNEATVGGYWGAKLSTTPYDGIIITGRARYPVYLLINEKGVEVKSAKEIWGLDTYATAEWLIKNHGPSIQIACIGPAGENKCKIAAIMFGGKDSRAAARGGMGAVMGSKNLKALVVKEGDYRLSVKEPDKLKNSIRKITSLLRENAKGLSDFGTAVGMYPNVEESGDLPIKNFLQGKWEKGAKKTTGETLVGRFFKKHYACFGCPIHCGKIIFVNGVEQHAPEYESNAAFGSLCLNDDLESISLANDLCNRYGLDTISTGASIAFAMEAYEKNLISERQTDGIKLTWGNKEAIVKIIHKIAKREGIGDILSQGVREAAKIIGKNSCEFAMQVKGMEIPLHDPRAYVSMALNYATGNRGACHLDALSYIYESGPKIEGLPKILSGPHSIEGKANLIIELQNFMTCLNALGLCKFLLCGRIGPNIITQWLNLAMGWDLEPQELMNIGEKLFNLKRVYNCRLGISRKDDLLPMRLLTWDKAERGAKGSLPHLGKMLGEYYKLRGWSEEGVPTEEKLNAL